MSLVRIEEIDLGSVEPIEKPQFAELTFVNITPWFGGKHTPNTIVCLDDGCNNYYISLPSSSSIKGLLRWLFRIAIASFVSDAELETYGYEACERFPSKDYPGLLEVIFGYVRGRKASQGIISIDVEARIKENSRYLYVDIATLRSGFSRVKGKDLPKILDEASVKIIRNDRNVPYPCNDPRLREFCQLFAIPRIRLLAQECFKKRDPNERIKCLFQLQPLREQSIELKLRLSVTRRSIAVGTRIVHLSDRFIALTKTAVVYAAILGLSLLGIGKATTRGFGKFVPIEVRAELDPDESRYLGSLVRWFKDPRSWNRFPVDAVFRHLCNKLLSLVKELSEEYLRCLGIENPELRQYNTVTVVPRLSNIEVQVIREPKHPCLLIPSEYPISKKVNNPRTKSMIEDFVNRYCSPRAPKARVRNVLELLSAIGKACLKITWKIYYFASSGTPVDEPGVAFHTWCLGLPRQARIRDPDLDTEFTTGYLTIRVVKDREGGESSCECSKDSTFNRCIYYETLERLVDDRYLKRWKSPIIFTPIADPLLQRVELVVVRLRHKDIAPLLCGVYNVKLVHVGRHDKLYELHVSPIIDVPCMPSIADRCGNDRGGIACYSDNPRIDVVECINADELVERCLNEAVNWIMNLLR